MLFFKNRYLCSMANPYFRFKQFTIWHDKCAMKVGTDGVLLGAWSHVGGAKTILDVGCGSGLIALMLAQRCDASVDAIDIDEGAFLQTQFNVEQSPFANRIKAHHSPLETYANSCDTRYDLIVSNPPFFRHSLRSPDGQRTLARHSDTLPTNSLLADSLRLLTPTGRIALILPTDNGKELAAQAHSLQLHPQRITHVHPTPQSASKRLLIELSPQKPQTMETKDLIIEEARHSYTNAFRRLTKDFYL